MNVQLLLPVHVYRVFYQVGTSQPVTKLEGLVLQAIQEGKSDLEQLAQVFCLHQRVLMEVVVALFGVGMLCLTKEGLLALPPSQPGCAGRSADSVASQAGPAQQGMTHVELQDEVQELIEERVLGHLCRSQWVRYRPLYSIARDLWNRLLPAGDLPSELQRGRCIPFLYPSQPDDPTRRFVHGILRTELVRARQDVVLVEVDTDQGTVNGLPKPWRTQLVPRLVAFAKAQVEKEGTPKVRAIRIDEPAAFDQAFHWEGTATPQEVVFRRGVSPEDSALCRALRDETAQHLLILTRTLALPAVDRLFTLLETAVKRGVQIDVLWGTSPDPEQVVAEASHREAIERLREFSRTARRARWPGGLSIGEQPSEVFTNLLFATRGSRNSQPQTVSVWWATKDWLAQREDRDELEIRHRGLVHAVCAILLDVLMGAGQLAHTATPTLLANMRDILLREQQRTKDQYPERDTLSVRLYLDGAHQHPSLDPLARLAKQTIDECVLLQHDEQLLLTSYRFANPRSLPRQRGYAGDLGIEVCGPLQQKEKSPP